MIAEVSRCAQNHAIHATCEYEVRNNYVYIIAFAIPIFPDIRFFTIESLYLFVTSRKGKGSRVGLHRESRRALGYYYLHAHSRHVVTTDH